MPPSNGSVGPANMQQEAVMLVRELMTQKVEWTTADTTLATAARRMRDLDVGCLPVGDSDSFIGMLTRRTSPPGQPPRA